MARVVDDSKVHGHSAILPTELCTAAAVAKLQGAERAVMLLVCCRLLSSVMDPAERLRSRITCVLDGAAYTASGSVVTDASWIGVDAAARTLVGGPAEKAESEESQLIPDGVSAGDSLDVREARVKEGKTAPPKPYTDATLLSAMEHAGRGIEDAALKAAIEDDVSHSGGLGTPATRAATIEKLVSDGYVERKGRSLRATERGMALVDAVTGSLKTPELTARWELELSRVEAGEARLESFMEGIESYTSLVVSEAKKGFDPSRRAALSGSKSVGACPLCGSPVVRRGGVYQCSSNRFSGKDDGYKLLEGCGFKLFAKQCRKELTDSQAARLLDGKTVHLAGLKRKDGTTFEADARLEPPYEGWVKFCAKEGGSAKAKGRPRRRRAGGR